MREDRERLVDILEAIERIEKYAVKGKDEFEKEELIQNWTIHHLQIIGEAASHLSDEFRKQHQEIPWSKIIGMRNILVHNYFEIDTAIVWAAVEQELPILKRNIKTIFNESTA